MRNIYDYTLEELEDYFVSLGDKKFRASQVFDFLYKKRVSNPNDMVNLGKKAQLVLSDNFSFDVIKCILKQEDI